MRAIILAAGMGTRLRPITLTTPKSLIEVAKETLIERQIRFLREKGIEEIVVVTGYLADKFNFLKDKYGVTLVHNEEYATYNNFYTMYLVREYLEDSYVIDADNYLVHNFLKSELNHSAYFSAYKREFVNEWVLHTDEMDRVIDVTIETGEGPIMCGVSYWSQQDGKLLQEAINERFATGNFEEIYWDDIVVENLQQLTVKRVEISAEDTYEIDSLEDLEALRKKVEHE